MLGSRPFMRGFKLRKNVFFKCGRRLKDLATTSTDALPAGLALVTAVTRCFGASLGRIADERFHR